MGSSTTVFWAVLNLVHLPVIVVPFLYWRKRDVDPINVRRPRIFIMALVSLCANIWHVLLRNLVGWSTTSWLGIVLRSVLMNPLAESFFVFALSLYIAYNKTKEQTVIYQALQKSSEIDSVDKFIRSIQFLSFLLSERFAYAWVVGHTLLWIIVVVSFLWVKVGVPNVLIPLNEIGPNAALAQDQATLMVNGRTLLTVVWLIVVSWRLRLVQDAFGTKSMLKKCGLVGIVNLAFNLLLERKVAAISSWNLQDVCIISFLDTILVVAFITPLFQARKRRRRIRTAIECDTTGDGIKSEFEAFLQTEDGFRAFKAHLEREFSVENVLFWKDVVLFRESCESDSAGTLSSQSTDLAWKIFDTYLSSSAPLEVNLPSKESMKFRAIFKDRSGDSSGITATIFDEAASQILLLMEVNSLKRFLRSNPVSWRNFKALCAEKMVVQQVDTLGNWVPAQNTFIGHDKVEISLQQYTATSFIANM